MPLSLVVKCSSPLETHKWFPKAYIARYVVASNVGGMDICTTILSIISPSLMAKEMVILTQIGNGETFARWFGNT
jgi:hypothetical protein